MSLHSMIQKSSPNMCFHIRFGKQQTHLIPLCTCMFFSYHTQIKNIDEKSDKDRLVHFKKEDEGAQHLMEKKDEADTKA